MERISFFKTLLHEKGQQNFTKILRSVNLEFFKRSATVCNYGEQGEKFYIVLMGRAGVKVPTEVKVQCKNYLDILKFLLKQKQNIIRTKDNHSKMVKKFLDVLFEEN